jgi:hypothetical protein
MTRRGPKQLSARLCSTELVCDQAQDSTRPTLTTGRPRNDLVAPYIDGTANVPRNLLTCKNNVECQVTFWLHTSGV